MDGSYDCSPADWVEGLPEVSSSRSKEALETFLSVESIESVAVVVVLPASSLTFKRLKEYCIPPSPSVHEGESLPRFPW